MSDRDTEAGFYRAHVFCCTNERQPGHPRGCCAAGDALRLRAYMKARVKQLDVPGVRVNIAGCLDRCELGPAMVIYPDNVWYTYRSRQDVDEIIDSHLTNGVPVARLMLETGQTELEEDRHWGDAKAVAD